MGILKILHHDEETTGRDPHNCAIHQLAGHIEIDGQIVESFNFHIRPHPSALISQEALLVSGMDMETILKYADGMTVMRSFSNLVEKYVDYSNPQDRMFTSAYNGASFDDIFLKNFFELNGCGKFRNYFWTGCLDTKVLALNKLSNERVSMPDFKLETVAKRFNIDVDEKQLHNAAYDSWLSHLLLKAINNR